jgi:hypothetical protein
MFPYKTLVIARQLDELRAEASARRLVAVRGTNAKDAPQRHSESVLDGAFVTPRLEGYPYPAR